MAVQYQDPTAAEIASWNAQLNSGTQTLATVQTAVINDPFTIDTVDPIIREYQAAFDRVPDEAGITYWVGQAVANPGDLSTLSTIFADSSEFTSLYGATATTPANAALVTGLYENVLGRAPDAAGYAFWLNSGLDAAQLLQDFAQSPEFINDTTAPIATFQTQISSPPGTSGQTYPTGSLFSVAPPTGTTYTLTTGIDTNATLGAPTAIPARDTVNGVINNPGITSQSTLNPGDTLNFAGGTLNIVDVTGTNNGLAGVTITGPFVFQDSNQSLAPDAFNFALNQSVTEAIALNNISPLTEFASLAPGAVVEVTGAASTGSVEVGYTNTTAPVTFAFDGGVNGLTIANVLGAGAPTSATIELTGAANGGAAGSAHAVIAELTDGAGSVTSLSIIAATNLNVALTPSDFANNAALVVKDGATPASWVDLTDTFAHSGTEAPFKSIDASGMTTGVIHVDGDAQLATFIGGAGVGNELLWDGNLGSLLPTSGALSYNGGSTTTTIDAANMGNIVSAAFIGATNAADFSNFQTLDVTLMSTGTPGSATLDTALMTNDTVMGAQFHASDSAVETLLHVAPAFTTLVTNPNATGDVVDAGFTITHSSATGASNTLDFMNTTTAHNLQLGILTGTSDGSITINSTGTAGGSSLPIDRVDTINQTDNVTTTVTVTGDANAAVDVGVGSGFVAPTGFGATLYSSATVPTAGLGTGGVHTDFDAGISGDTASSLTTIDGSGTTGGVVIVAGDTDLVNGHNLTYTGLTIKGGSGNGDFLYDGANSGVVTDGSGNHDAIVLGGSAEQATFGSGAGDIVSIGWDAQVGGASALGAALGANLAFGAGATGVVQLQMGAELAAAPGAAGTTSATQTNITSGATTGSTIDFAQVGLALVNNVTVYTPVPADTTFALAEAHAVGLQGATTGLVQFSYGGNEYLIGHLGANAGALGVGDTVVDLVGLSGHTINVTAGVAVVH